MFEIEKGIEMPKTLSRRGMYPFAEMEVGDSFFVAAQGEDSRIVRQRVSAAASHRGARNGGQYSCAMVEGGTRCWRVS